MCVWVTDILKDLAREPSWKSKANIRSDYSLFSQLNILHKAKGNYYIKINIGEEINT